MKNVFRFPIASATIAALSLAQTDATVAGFIQEIVPSDSHPAALALIAGANEETDNSNGCDCMQGNACVICPK